MANSDLEYEKIINNNRIEFINKIDKINEKCFIACLDIIEFRMINNIYGYSSGNSVIIEILNFIYNTIKKIDVNIDVCLHEKDTFIIIVYTNEEDIVNKFIKDITNNNYSYDIKFRAAYMEIIENNDIYTFLENIMKIIRDDKFSLIDSNNFEYKFKGELNVRKDIDKYNELKREILEAESSYFKILYQPKVDLEKERVISCEVLSRWIHPILGTLSPLEFLPIIHNLNKEVEFDLFVLELLCKDITKINYPLNLFSINMSVNTISKVNICEDIMEIINKYNIEPQNITIEVLEGAEVKDIHNFKYNINELSNIGFTISIDDFGTGYSSYFRISDFSFSEVKIPREFLSNNKIYDEKNIKVLSSVINMCKDLGYKIVSEGIETEADQEIMKSLGVDYAQGYLYSKPLQLDEFLNFVKKYNFN